MQKRLAGEPQNGEVAWRRRVRWRGCSPFSWRWFLGTLIGVSFALFSTQKTELEGFSAQVCGSIRRSQNMGRRPKPARDKLKAGIVKGYETFWGGGDVDPNALSAAVPLANAHAMNDFLATLQPKTDQQKQALATANQYNSMVEQSRLLMSLQVASPTLSVVLIAIMVCWTVALCFGLGMFAEIKSLVLSALAFGAVSIAFAIFLILELGFPLHRPDAGFARRARANDRVSGRVVELRSPPQRSATTA